MKKAIALLLSISFVAIMFSGVYSTTEKTEAAVTPVFTDVSVHDPSVMKANGAYYILGSHMGAAKSYDLQNWSQFSYSADNTSLFKNIRSELSEALSWGQSDTFWAGDWIQLKNGKYYMYYCVCRGDCPQSCIGYAVADSPEGPYTNKGILLKSSGTSAFYFTNADGTTHRYDANVHPNAIDPNVFYDKNGNLWMTYGSYSGGIYILQLDANTGAIKSGQDYYGTKLMGGYHSRVEAPYIMYSPETDYYYMFISFGGLGYSGGYNIRVSRSRNPNGPYVDSMGNNMINCKGKSGQFLEAQDSIINAYGTEILGNNMLTGKTGYVSPGHNSAYYDAETGKYYLVFHSRFPGQGEGHAVRVHQMFMNAGGWPVVAPNRYSGETIRNYSSSDVVGTYQYVDIGRSISSSIASVSEITLNSNGTVTGSAAGSWSLSNGNQITIKIGSYTHSGVFIRQYDMASGRNKLCFSAVGSTTGKTVMGIKKDAAATVVSSGKTVCSTSLLSDVSYVIKNVYSGLKMELTNASIAEGTNIQQWSHIAGPHQEWRIVDLGNGYCKIVSMSDENMAVTVEGNSTSDGSNVKLSSYVGSTGQQFKVTANSDGSYAILTRCSSNASGLEVFNWSSANGGNISQWNYWGGDCQKWYIQPSMANIVEGTYYLRNVNSGKMLDITNGVNENGTNVQQWSANTFDPQVWKVEGVGNGCYKLSTPISGFAKCLDVVGGNNDGDNVIIYDYWGGINQQFLIEPTSDGSFAVKTRASGGTKALEVYNLGTEDGANVIQWTYWGGAGQRWVFVPAD